MASAEDQHQSKLIDRLASTTLRLRNLFYVNLVLAAAIIFFVFQDSTFVSEKIGPAVATMQPIVEVDKYLRAHRKRFEPYQAELEQAASQILTVSSAVDKAEEDFSKLPAQQQRAVEETAAQELSEGEIDFLNNLAEVHKNSEGAMWLLKGYFDLDLETADYQHLAGFGVFLLFDDAWTQALKKGRDIVIKADIIHPANLIGPAARELKLGELSLEWYNVWVLHDSLLTSRLENLPKVGDFLNAAMIIEAFCSANRLGNCSLADIAKWRKARASKVSSKLTAPGIEVQIARDFVVPVSPLILLVAFHLYVMQFRRRQALREELAPQLSLSRLNLLDETWVLNGLLLNIAGVRGLWRRLQSLVMAAFFVAGQAAPLAAILVAGYYIFNQVLLGAFIADELASAMADLKEAAASIGVDALPDPPVQPGLFLEYLWIAVAAFCLVVVVGSLYQLLRDQGLEIFSAWRRRGTN